MKIEKKEDMIRIAAARAMNIVSLAVKNGELPNLKKRIVFCVDCKESRATEYDHRDYSQPLKVYPVCHPCNTKRGPAIVSKEIFETHYELRAPFQRQDETLSIRLYRDELQTIKKAVKKTKKPISVAVREVMLGWAAKQLS